MSVLIFKGPTFEKIWGSPYFMEHNISNNPLTGELWSLSGYESKSSICINGIYKDKTLDDIYKNYPSLFNSKENKFPILVKLIATKEPLSVQVHPNDDYATKYENSLGKTEGWLIVDAKDDSKIVLGHNANSKDELIDLIDNHKFDDLLIYQKISIGEFYPIPSGTIHALGSNIVLIEIQQSSDITYRVYDYDRLGLDGKLRELHLDKAKDVISLDKYNYDIKNIYKENNDLIWENNYFTVSKKNINGEVLINKSDIYQIVTVSSGEIIVDGYKLNIGDSFIIPCNEDLIINGDGLVLITNPLK